MAARRSVRAADVAKAASVSVGTVSKVLNGKPGRISRETRERVAATASRLGYRPDPLARSLRIGSMHTLGLIVPELGDQYFEYIARGAEAAARDRGFGIVLSHTDRDPRRELEAIDFLIDKAVDGVVLCGGGIQQEEHLESLDWGTLRVVSVGPHQIDVPNLAVDNKGAMRAAVAHLAGLGRQRILCIAGQRDWLITAARLAAVRAAMAEHRLEVRPELLRCAGFTSAAGASAMTDVLAEGVQFDAILCFNDYAAVGAMAVLATAGWQVPEDVAVVGCDDTDIAAYARVPLTTIRFPAAELGAAAVRVLCDGENFTEPFGFELITRESTLGSDHDRRGRSPHPRSSNRQCAR